MEREFANNWRDPNWRVCVYKPVTYSSYLSNYEQTCRQPYYGTYWEDYWTDPHWKYRSTSQVRDSYCIRWDEEPRRSLTRISPVNRSTRKELDFKTLYRSASQSNIRSRKPANKTQTVEIEERDDADPSHTHTLRESFAQKMAEARMNDSRYTSTNFKEENESKVPKDSFIDTIINYDENAGDLSIANIVKIGDRIITREWDWGDELKIQNGK